jgi:AraC-like DNA-binding protein
MNRRSVSALGSLACATALFLSSACGADIPASPAATHGVIDLSRWDFVSDGPIPLDGEWEFRWKEFTAPRDFPSGDGTAPQTFFILPGSWNPGFGMYAPAEYSGYATFRLRINVAGKGDQTVDSLKALGLRMPVVHSAYRLFVNGELAHAEGVPSENPAKVMTGTRDAIVPLPPSTDGYDLVIHVANADFPVGGFDESITVGTLRALYADRQGAGFAAMALALLLLLLGLFQLVMFAFDPEGRHYLYFGLTCLCLVVYVIGLNDTSWQDALPFLDWARINNYMASALYLTIALFFAYLRRLFPYDVPRNLTKAAFAIAAPLALAMLALRAEWFGYLLAPEHAATLVAIPALAFIIVRVTLRRRPDSSFVLAGLAVLVVAIVVDVFSLFGILPVPFEAGPWGVILTCAIQTFGMSRDFVRSRARSTALVADNEELRRLIEALERPATPAITDAVEAKIDRAIAIARERFFEDLTREGLAAAVGLHPDNFGRYFKLRTGAKFGDYLNELRVAEAIRLLGETELPVIDVAMEVGYRSLRTFNHAFANLTGKKPGDYRAGR